MIFEETIKVPVEMLNKVNKYLTQEPKNPEECLSENKTISVTAKFTNGYQMDIKCCGVQYDPEDSNCAWSEAVLFNERGGELICSEPDDEFAGEWFFEYNGDEYKVNIVPET